MFQKCTRRYLGMSQDDKAALKDTEVGRIDAAIACSNMRQVLPREMAVASLIRSRRRTQQGKQVRWQKTYKFVIFAIALFTLSFFPHLPGEGC